LRTQSPRRYHNAITRTGRTKMAKIRVEQIIIENFKKISKLTINLKPITALVGGNASGKSSILQAAQLCTSLAQGSFISEGRTVKYLKTLANEDVSYRPTEKLLNLRHGDPANQTKNFKLGFECTLIDDKNNETKMSLTSSVYRGKNANLSLIYSGDTKLIAKIGDRESPFSILTPGLSGIPLREEWRTRGALDAAAMHGDANLYLRTLLDHLLHKDTSEDDVIAWNKDEITIEGLPLNSSWRKFSTLLDECYPGAKLYINHNNRKDRYVEVSAKYLGNKFTLDSASTGMLQVIQILAYACFYSPPLLLLDEPDAHLHADSQIRLHQALKSITKSTHTRIVLATHSPQLMQLLMNDTEAQVVWLSAGNEVVVPEGQKPAIPLLMELGALTIGADAFDRQNKVILLTEDKEAELVKTLAKSNTANSFACLSYNGCGNLAGARQLALLLSEIRPDAKIIIHRDRDFRTHEELEFEKLLVNARLQLEGATNIHEIFTPLNDVEHSLLNIEHLKHSLKTVANELQIQTALADAINKKRDDLTGKLRSAREVIERALYDCERMKSKKALRAQSAISDKPPKLKTLLPLDGTHPLDFEICHGKTLFKAFITELHSEIKGDSKAISKLIITQSKHLKDPDWKTAFA